MGASCLLAVKPGFQWHKATGELVESHARRKASERATRYRTSGRATQYRIIAPRGQVTRWRRCVVPRSLVAISAPCGRAAWWPFASAAKTPATLCRLVNQGAQKGAGTHHDAAFSPSDASEENLGAAIGSRPFQEHWSQRRSCTAETQPAIP